jgi:hypothetical protein
VSRIWRFLLSCLADDLLRIDCPGAAGTRRVLLQTGHAEVQKSLSPASYRMPADVQQFGYLVILFAFGSEQYDSSAFHQPSCNTAAALIRLQLGALF